MNRFLFLKDKELEAAQRGRKSSAPVMDPKLLVLMSARYV